MLSTIRGELPPQIPYQPVMPERYYERWKDEVGEDPGELYHLGPIMQMVTPRTRGAPMWDMPFTTYQQDPEEFDELRSRFSRYLPKQLPPGARITEYGAVTVPGSMYHLRHPIYPLAEIEKASDLENYLFPDSSERWRWQGLAEEAQKFLKEDYLVMGGVPSIFESAWYLRGQEQMLADMALGSDIAEFLLDWMARDRATMARRLAEMHIDVLGLGDDLGTQHGPLMSRDMLHRWILPRYERVISAAKSIKPNLSIIMHTDGKNQHFLADLLAIGVDGITPVQPELDDPRFLKEKFGSRLILWGTLSSRTTSFGSPDDLEAEIRDCMKLAKEFCGFILGFNNALDVNTPFQNLTRYHEAAEKYGKV